MSKPNALISFWSRNTYGSATLDVARTHVFDDAIHASATESLLPEPKDETNPFASKAPLGPVKARFSTSGVRIKVMRHMAFGPERTERVHGRDERCPVVDVAAGVAFDFDSASFQPKARVRLLRTVSIVAFPGHFRVQRRIPIGLTGFSLKVLWFCPIRHLPRVFEAPARLILSVDDTDHYGVRLVTNGIEVAGNRIFKPPIGKSAVLMGSAHLKFPSTMDFGSDQWGHTWGEEFAIKLGRTALKMRF